PCRATPTGRSAGRRVPWHRRSRWGQRADGGRICQPSEFAHLARAPPLVRRTSAWQGCVVPTSTAITNGIRVTGTSGYEPAQSSPTEHRYVFAYTVKVANEGTETAQLRSRHWIITHGNGKVEEVRGPGVVGHQPVLRPGEQFEYTS